jgi:hypothetical protein
VFGSALPPIIEGKPRLTDSGPAFTVAPFGKQYIISFADLRKAKELLDQLEKEDIARFVTMTELAATGAECTVCGNRFELVEPVLKDDDGRPYCSQSCLGDQYKDQFH